MRVAFLTRYGPGRASSRVRAFDAAPLLEAEGDEVRVLAWGMRSSRFSQFKYAADALKLAGWADVVVLQKPAHPPSLLDAIARRNPRLVVDFDDAVWASPTREGERQAPDIRPSTRSRHRAGRCGHRGRLHLLAAAVLRGHPDAEVTVMPSPVDSSVGHGEGACRGRPTRRGLDRFAGEPGGLRACDRWARCPRHLDPASHR